MRRIAVMNNKGGVGKTITSINLADILNRKHGKSVALADCDGQMNLTRFFLPGFDSDKHSTMATVLAGGGEQVWSDNLLEIRDGLHLLPASSDLYALDVEAIKFFSGNPYKMRHFCDSAEVAGKTDFFIFDCPPGFTAASCAALIAADEVVIPMTVDGFSFQGMADMTAQIKNLRKLNDRIKISGILVTQWHNSDVVKQGEELLRQLPVPVFRQVIRRTDKVMESTFSRKPIVDFSPTSAASRDYRAWVDELLGV